MPALDKRRVYAVLAEPQVLSTLVVAGLLVVVGARHPIAEMIGTEKAAPTVVPAVAAPVVPHAPAVTHSAPVHPPVPFPTHAPRDPFHPLLTEAATAGSAPVAAAPVAAVPAPVAPPAAVVPVVPKPTATTPAPATHPVVVAPKERYVVRPGDSLWRISANLLGSGASEASIERLMAAIYERNHAVIGPDPAHVEVGVTLDLTGLH